MREEEFDLEVRVFASLVMGVIGMVLYLGTLSTAALVTFSVIIAALWVFRGSRST